MSVTLVTSFLVAVAACSSADADIEAARALDLPLEECDAELAVGETTEVSGDVNVMALGDSGAAKPTKPKPPTKPKVCKDAGADASKKKECDPADLAEGCTCEKLEELYKLQKEMCANVRACSKGDFCTNIDDKMSNRRNCINLRRDVQLCYKKPDFGGHQEAIDTQCRGLQECADIWRTKKCGDDLPIVVPAACPQVK